MKLWDDGWVKWKIALWVDKRHEACWFELVLWVLGNLTTWECFFQGYWKDQSCTEETGYYCGKCGGEDNEAMDKTRSFF